MARIHDKFVIELREVIKGYANDPEVKDPFNLPCDYKFYEIDGIALSEETFHMMKPLKDYMEWIPCSERKPEKYGEYMVTWSTSLHGRRFIGVCECEVTNELDEENERFKVEWILEEHMKSYPGVKILAWRELPDVWEGNDEK